MRAATLGSLLRLLAQLAACSAFGSGPGVAGGPPPIGGEFQVNSYTTSSQRGAAVAADPEGNFLAAWLSFTQDGLGGGVFAQRYDAAGDPVGGEFQVNTHTPEYQLYPAVAADAAGNFVGVWASYWQDGSNFGIFGQRYDAGGVPLGREFQVNTHTPSFQTQPAIAAAPAGNFVVVWEGGYQDGSYSGVFGQRYDADGDPLGGEFQVNTSTTLYQYGPAVAIANAGDFVVVWTSYYFDGSSNGIFGQRYDALGNREGTEFLVNSYTTWVQSRPAVAMEPSGEFVVVWQSFLLDGSDYEIAARRFDAAGAPLGPEFPVNVHTTDQQTQPTVAADPTGSFVVIWESLGQDGSGAGLFGRAYDSDGSAIGEEFQVNTYTTAAQSAPAVSRDATDELILVWASEGQDGSGDGVFGQRFRALLFADGFESGSTSAWDQTAQ